MANMDRQNLVENFYRWVFSSREQGVYYHLRMAEALQVQDTVVRIQRKKGSGMALEHWVNYIYYGA